MKRVSGSFLLPISIDERGRSPIYRQLYEWVRAAILAGLLRPGQRMPSTRGLAAHLKISRIPTMSAYEQLLAEGYLETFTGLGTRVARQLPDDALRPAGGQQAAHHTPRMRNAPRRVSRRGAALLRTPVESGLSSLSAFRVSLPALDHFPVETWSKLLTRHARAQCRSSMAYGDAMGLLPLREAIAEYLGASRAVRCTPSQILITTGSQQALQLCAHVLLDPGERICMEEPGYPGARNTFAAAGTKVMPVAVGNDGMNLTGLMRQSDVRAVYVTPSHQYPTGVTMSAARRLTLLHWAAKNGTWVIEDDYDSEYRFGSRPIASLQGIDTQSRVIYIGSFSKVLFPALRLGYMVIPDDLVLAFAAARDAADIFSSTLYQLVMTDFIREGHFSRHLRRMRMLYMERRRVVVSAIRAVFGESLEVIGADAGMHLVALLPKGVSDVAVSQAARDARVSVIPLSSCYWKKPARGGLILGYGGVDEEQIQDGMRKLKACIEGASA
jgi:GntR family transcriptional regulator / MocR family aminotransferase